MCFRRALRAIQNWVSLQLPLAFPDSVRAGGSRSCTSAAERGWQTARIVRRLGERHDPVAMRFGSNRSQSHFERHPKVADSPGRRFSLHHFRRSRHALVRVRAHDPVLFAAAAY
jgi:hypothetical protein